MFRHTIVLSFLLVTCSKVILANFQDNRIDEDSYPRKVYLTDVDDSENKQQIWVLELNDGGLVTLKLREANEDEENDFQYYTQPLVDNYSSGHNVVKKDGPKSLKPEVVDKKKINTKKLVSKNDIFKYINKFALYSKSESDAYQSDSHENDDPSIALYFKGRFTSLIVKEGIRQWHYFIPPPSILPAWFYEDHGTLDSLEVPTHVTDEFYSSLLRLLQALLRYPL